MRKVAIVGVEGAGKTVMLAGLGELYTNPDADGYFLAPKNFDTASYVSEVIQKMRTGSWPAATAVDTLEGLDWILKRRVNVKSRPKEVCEISFLDFAGEVYRVAFGTRRSNADQESSEQAEALKDYLKTADEIIVLINLSDIIKHGSVDKRTQEAMWITNGILDASLEESEDRDVPRAAIVLSQSDNYADTIVSCGGPAGVLRKYLPHVANNYGWLDVFSAHAVDSTVLDGDGRVIPARDFRTDGLKPIMDWILNKSFCSDNSAKSQQDVAVSTSASSKKVNAAAEKAYFQGKKCEEGDGVPKNLLMAIHWYRKAADEGSGEAMYSLARMYETGKVFKRNLQKAEQFYRKALAAGCEHAKVAVSRVQKQQADPDYRQKSTGGVAVAGDSGANEESDPLSLGKGILIAVGIMALILCVRSCCG